MYNPIKGKKYLTTSVIAIVLIVFTVFVIKNLNSDITGAVVGDLGDITGNVISDTDIIGDENAGEEDITTDDAAEATEELVGCNYNNPPCESNEVCVYQLGEYICRGLGRSGGGGGGGSSTPVLPILGGVS